LLHKHRGRRGHNRMVVQSVPITTKVASLNPVHGEVYSIQHCDKVCQRLATGRWFSAGSPVSSTNKTEILLKVALKHHQTNNVRKIGKNRQY